MLSHTLAVHDQYLFCRRANVLSRLLVNEHRCKKKFFTFFYSWHVFTFLTFFYFPTFFIFKNVHWKYRLKSFSKQRKQIGSVWLFFFVRISISTYILTSIVIYLPYRLTSSDATRRCVFVHVGKLVCLKILTFFIQRLPFFIYIFTFFTFLTFFQFFSGTFIHLCKWTR